MYCKQHDLYNPSLLFCPICRDSQLGEGQRKITSSSRVYVGELHTGILMDIKSETLAEDLAVMEAKLRELSATKQFSSYDSRLMFEDAFRLGYLATRAEKSE